MLFASEQNMNLYYLFYLGILKNININEYINLYILIPMINYTKNFLKQILNV